MIYQWDIVFFPVMFLIAALSGWQRSVSFPFFWALAIAVILAGYGCGAWVRIVWTWVGR